MTTRQSIVDAFVTRLSAVTGVIRADDWVVHKLGEKEMPALIIRDAGSKTDTSTSYSITHVLSVEVDILVSDSDTTMSKLREIMAGVLTAIGAEGDDLIYHRTYDGDDILAEHQDRFYGGARMKFSVEYSTAAWEI